MRVATSGPHGVLTAEPGGRSDGAHPRCDVRRDERASCSSAADGDFPPDNSRVLWRLQAPMIQMRITPELFPRLKRS